MTLAWRRRARPLLGTLVEIAVQCESEAELARLVGPAFARVQDYHDAMSRHLPTSDVCRIAVASAGQTVTIGADTSLVLSMALALERTTHGVFDVAIHDRATASRRSAGQSLRLHPAGGAVTVLAPVCIDVGGIAKGAAVDMAVGRLSAGGATLAIVNAGGDLAVLGKEPQPILVRGPGAWRVHAGRIADGAVATSGPYDDGQGSTLTIAPDCRAAWADRTVTVIAQQCFVADALTKIVAILGQGAASLLERVGASAFSVDRSGTVEHVVVAERPGRLVLCGRAGPAWPSSFPGAGA